MGLPKEVISLRALTPSTTTGDGNKGRILVVGESSARAGMFRKYVCAKKYLVVKKNSVSLALKALSKQHFDVVFINFDDFKEITLISEIRAQFSYTELPIMVQPSKYNETYNKRLYQLGANHCTSQTKSNEHLLNRLEELISFKRDIARAAILEKEMLAISNTILNTIDDFRNVGDVLRKLEQQAVKVTGQPTHNNISARTKIQNEENNTVESLFKAIHKIGHENDTIGEQLTNAALRFGNKIAHTS